MGRARDTDTLVGRELGEFVLRERIGEGGFGAVYRAHQPALDREAVIKVLHSRLHASKAATERFLREARLASKLDHPYAAHIYAFGAEPDGELWIAMELVRGTPLDKVLTAQGKLSLERFAPLLDRICEVVHTAHEQGIVHRDLKPANVMVLNRAGRMLPKLLDFGIAKGLVGAAPADPARDDTVDPDALAALHVTAETLGVANTLDTGDLAPVRASQDALELTQRGAIMGSPFYMAPEQWVDAGSVDPRTDLYALGVLAYECLTGSPPFTGSTVTQVAQAHAKLPPPPLGPRFPGALDQVFAKVLAKRPDDRYADVLSFVSAFRAASGVASDAAALPILDPEQRDAAINGAVQPIAEAVAVLDGARNAHQARDAVVQVAHAIVRYLALLAVACRSRVTGGDEPAAVAELLRQSYRRALTDKEWLELARSLTRSWQTRREAYPVPELVDAFHGERAVAGDLERLCGLRERELTTSEVVLEALSAAIAQLARVLERLELVRAYSLLLVSGGGVGERWMGVRRSSRATMPVRGKGVRAGDLALVDGEGTPVLALSPLFQVAPPTPGASLELFMFDGRDARGAKLVALPGGFEYHDDTLWGWFRTQLSGTLDDNADTSSEEQPPYRGLSAFSAADGALFFGREKQIDAFVNRLKVQPLLAVIGPSGAGKSSFVYAGVGPALGWRVVAMRPGPSPLAALVARLEHEGLGKIDRAALAQDRDALGDHLRVDAIARGPLVLVVDQLEEMFTLCRDDDERRVFADALAAAARSPDDPLRVVFTLRDDFLVRTELVPALRDRIGQGLQLLTAPGAEDLERIVTEPARRAGYELEGTLARDMVREVADQPGALALISFTAAKLWELRDRHFKQLTRSAYKSLGGVGGALAHHADVTLDAMPPEERALAREAFRQLVTTQSTRAVVARTDLAQLLGGRVHAEAVIEKLVAARLLVASENEAGAETVEIVHEALLFAWPRLVEWRREDSEGARFREQLRTAVKQWDTRGRDRGLLWRGDALADFTRWRARHTGPLTDAEAAFATAILADAARSRRNRRIVLAAAFAALAAVVVVLVVSNARISEQKHEAEQANEQLNLNLQAQWENQGRLYMLQDDPLRGLAALVHASELGAHGWQHEFLVAQGVRATDGAQLRLLHDGPARSPRFTHDGKRLVTASLDGKVRIWDASTGNLLRELQHGGSVTRTAISPDDKTILSGGVDSTVRWWEADSGRELHRFDQGARVRCVLFSPDGQLALTAGEDDSAVLWQLPGATARVRVHGDGAGITDCAFSADGELFACGDHHGTTRIWKVATGELRAEHRDQHEMITSIRFSPDGTHVVASSDDHSVVVWDARTGSVLHRFEHGDTVGSAEFAPDGNSVLTASLDHTAVVWDVGTGARSRTLAERTAGIHQARFSPDGELVVTCADDGTVQLWDVLTGQSIAKWRGHEGYVVDGEFDRSGRRVVTASNDRTVIVWSVISHEQVLPLHAPPGTTFARFSRDGAKIAIGNRDGTARLWDTSSGLEIAEVGHRGDAPVSDLAFDSSGKLLAVGALDTTVRIWDVRARAAKLELAKHAAQLEHMEWSPDDALLITGTTDGRVRAYDAASGETRLDQVARDGIGVEWVAFDPKMTTLTVVTYGGTVQTWDLAGKELGRFEDIDQPFAAVFDPSGTRLLTYDAKHSAKIRPVTGSASVVEITDLAQITYAAWSPDARLVITACLDGTARLWDAHTGEQLQAFPMHDSHRLWVDFAPDGRILIAGDDGTTVIRHLATYQGTLDALRSLVRCRVPFEVRGDHLTPRERSRECGRD